MTTQIKSELQKDFALQCPFTLLPEQIVWLIVFFESKLTQATQTAVEAIAKEVSGYKKTEELDFDLTSERNEHCKTVDDILAIINKYRRNHE